MPWRFLLIGAARYARSTVASAVKLMLGRKAHYTADDVLFRQYLGRLIGFGTLQAITSAHSPREGAGSHALMAMNAIRFAREQGLIYVHTPFREIHHADRPAGQWAADWENHFNLGDGEARAIGTPVNYALTSTELTSLFGVELMRPFDEQLRADFRRKYRLGKPARNNPVVDVCVHVRRRNRHDFHDEDSTDLAQLAAVVARLRAMLVARGQPFALRLFSQGSAAEFDPLGLDRDALFLDADPFWTMRELIAADLLVLSRGTFSYVSGLLCGGAVLADPRQFPLQPDWTAYDEAGAFDVEALRRRLSGASES